MQKKQLTIMAIAAILGLALAALGWTVFIPAGAWVVKFLSSDDIVFPALLAIGFYCATLFVFGMLFSRLLPKSRLSIQLLQIPVCYVAQVVVVLLMGNSLLYTIALLAVPNSFSLIGFIFSSQGRSASHPIQ